MRGLLINLTVALLTFASTVAANHFFNLLLKPMPQTMVLPSSPEDIDSIETANEPSDDHYTFDNGRLKIVNEEVQMKSESLRYDIDVRYPQIVGTDGRRVIEFNRRIRNLVIAEYDWMLNPSKEELKDSREKWPEVFNSVEVDYEVVNAHDSFLSLYLNVISYGIGAAHSNQMSHSINYDFKLRRELQLTELFKPDSKYLNFIASYCTTELSKKQQYPGRLTSRSNFNSWNITPTGVRFNFDRCEVLSCSEGEQTVEIPFVELKPFLIREF